VAVGLAAALGAALVFGVASILQAAAAAGTVSGSGVDPRLLVRLSRRPGFLVALALNLVGFGLHLYALRALPLFLAQAAIAGNVAVTAVLAVVVLRVRLGAAGCAGVGAVCLGLALITGAAGPAGQDRGSMVVRAFVLVAVVAVAAAGVLADRVAGASGVVLLGLTAGLGFGLVSVAARLLPTLAVGAVLADAATYALVAAGAVAFLLYVTALQRGPVTTVISAMVLTQTVAPAVIGVVLLGDRVRPGGFPLALAGTVLALAGTIALARFEAGPALAGPRARDPER
jgi:drug/metabolite transporter (DMT)-like permease